MKEDFITAEQRMKSISESLTDPYYTRHDKEARVVMCITMAMVATMLGMVAITALRS